MCNSAAEEPPHKKVSPSSSLCALSSLPDEIVLNCLVRVSRSDQPALSMVSKSYRSLVASPETYKMRSSYGCTENCTYVCLLTPPDPTPRWFILCRGKNGDRLLSPIPSCPSQAEEGSSVVVLDWGIYVIGGLIKGKPTSDVFLLDCRTHTWHQVPSMRAARYSAATGVVNGKIYVFGSRQGDFPNWAECFNPETQTWVTLPSPDRKTRSQYLHSSVVVREEKIYAVDLMERSFYYSPSEGKWGRGSGSEVEGIRRDWCVIGNIIYTCDRHGNLCWCEIEQLEHQGEELMNWRQVKGLDSLHTKLNGSKLIHFDGILDDIWTTLMVRMGRTKKLIDLYPGVRLSNSGPNLVLFWDVIKEDHLEIWSAEVSLETRHSSQIWASLEWSHPVMKASLEWSHVIKVDSFLRRYKVLHSVCVTI